MAIETRTHSFPGIPDSRTGKLVMGFGLLAIPFVANVARNYLRSPEPQQTESDFKVKNSDLQPGDLVEGASFLEVGADQKLHFHGPDPRITEVILVNNLT